MTASDRTAEFREVLGDAQRALPEAKRRRVQRSSPDAPRDAQLVLNKEYLAEGYAIVRLSAFSATVGLNPW